MSHGLSNLLSVDIRFRVSCNASFGGPVPLRMWSDLDAPPPLNQPTTDTWPRRDWAEAFGRRLDAAMLLHSFELDPKRCVISRTRLSLVGTGRYKEMQDASEAVGSVVALARWTLIIVYGHPGPCVGLGAPKLPGLSLTVAEIRTR